MTGMDTAVRIWAGTFCVIVAVAFIIGGAAAAADTSTADPATDSTPAIQDFAEPPPVQQDSNMSTETTTVGGDVEVETTLTSASGEQMVIVEFGPGSPLEGTAGTESNTAIDREEQIKTLQAHAEETQAAFLDTAAGSAHIEVHREFWITSAVVATVDTDEVSVHDLARIDHVTRISKNELIDHHGNDSELNHTAAPATTAPEFRNHEWGLDVIAVLNRF